MQKYKEGRRQGSHMDVIRKQHGAEILYNKDDEILPEIRGSQLENKPNRNHLNVAGSQIMGGNYN